MPQPILNLTDGGAKLATGPLTEYQVLDLADESGVYGTKLLADMGARVIKVEPPEGDRTRRLPPFFRGQEGAERSIHFAYMNTNKQSITLNLETAEGQSLFRKLVQRVDVVYETFPRGHLSQRGIGYAEVRTANPNLVWVALTPFGQTGPRRDWKGSDLVGWASSSVLYLTGDPDRPPLVPGGGQTMVAYSVGSINAAVAVLMALRVRRIAGRGQYVDISLQDCGASITPEASLPTFLETLVPRVRGGNHRRGFGPFGFFACQDGYAVIIILRPHHWDAIAAWVKERTGIEEITDPFFKDRENRSQMEDVVDGWIEALTTTYTKQDLTEEGQRRGIPVTPVNTPADVGRDPHLEARNYWEDVDHPVLGRLRMAGAPYKFSKTPWNPGRAPLLGEHNEAIYCGELGLTANDLAALQAAGVI